MSPGTDREVRTILEIMARCGIPFMNHKKMNIIGKIKILFPTFKRFRDLPPDPTECGCLKTLVRDKILRLEIFLD